jgi:hypothetical protein
MELRHSPVKPNAPSERSRMKQPEKGLPFFEDLLMDIRYALRVLWQSPAFTLVASVTLMLGIGANVAVFGVLNAVLLRPLDVSDPQNLYQLRLKPWTSFKLLTTSYPAFEDFRQRNSTFSGMAAFNGYARARLGWGHAVRVVSGHAVTGNYFELLGVRPEVGRFFQATDEHGPNSAPYVVLSHDLWRSAFNADPGVVGTSVRLDKDPFTVVGVAPAQFHGTEKFVWPDYWMPIANLGGGLLAHQDLPIGDGAWPAEAGRDAPTGDGRSEFDRCPDGEGVSRDRQRTATAAGPSRTLRRQR